MRYLRGCDKAMIIHDYTEHFSSYANHACACHSCVNRFGNRKLINQVLPARTAGGYWLPHDPEVGQSIECHVYILTACRHEGATYYFYAHQGSDPQHETPEHVWTRRGEFPPYRDRSPLETRISQPLRTECENRAASVSMASSPIVAGLTWGWNPKPQQSKDDPLIPLEQWEAEEKKRRYEECANQTIQSALRREWQTP